jgi:hypothetical protein
MSGHDPYTAPKARFRDERDSHLQWLRIAAWLVPAMWAPFLLARVMWWLLGAEGVTGNLPQHDYRNAYFALLVAKCVAYFALYLMFLRGVRQRRLTHAFMLLLLVEFLNFLLYLAGGYPIEEAVVPRQLGLHVIAALGALVVGNRTGASSR